MKLCSSGSTPSAEGSLESKDAIVVHKTESSLFRKDLISAMKLADSEQLQEGSYFLISDPWRQEWEKGVQVPVNMAEIMKADIKLVFLELCLSRTVSPHKLLHERADETYKKGMHELTGMQQLAEQLVRYDLDDLDVCWLEEVNLSRLELGLIQINEWNMERVMEALEYQCHEKMTAIMKTEEGLGIEYDEDVVCDVCRSLVSDLIVLGIRTEVSIGIPEKMEPITKISFIPNGLEMKTVLDETDEHDGVKLKLDEEIVGMIFSYWKLKRKSNWDKPLLTPKTEEADILEKQQEDSLVARMKMFVHLRQDLERDVHVRNLCYMIGKREKMKRQFFKCREYVFTSMVRVLIDKQLDLSESDVEGIIASYHFDSLYDNYGLSVRDLPTEESEEADNSMEVSEVDDKSNLAENVTVDVEGASAVKVEPTETETTDMEDNVFNASADDSEMERASSRDKSSHSGKVAGKDSSLPPPIPKLRNDVDEKVLSKKSLHNLQIADPDKSPLR
nr:hypothetical protein BaRGS_000791 [Batillaria attramentaria]